MDDFPAAQFLDRIDMVNEFISQLEAQGEYVRQMWDEYVQGDKTGRYTGEIRHGDQRQYSRYDWEFRWDEQMYYPGYVPVFGSDRRNGELYSYTIPQDFILNMDEWFKRQPEENRAWQEEEDERIEKHRIETERAAIERRRQQYEALREEFGG